MAVFGVRGGAADDGEDEVRGPSDESESGDSNLTVPGYNLRYAGQYFDGESGLHYNGYRTYDPKVGGYTQNDPIGLEGGWNRRVYVEGNPLNFIDPDGLQIKGTRNPVVPLEGYGGGGGTIGGGGGARSW